uniref:GAS2-like protein 2 isoform X1 n=2 Tax=Hirondellea gigas TaxID=1518452 RepID=A0A6A7G5X4_9CRUS
MGDMNQVLSSPVLNEVQNMFTNHNGLDELMEEDDNPSFNLINEIASSLSNQYIPMAPPLPPKPSTNTFSSSNYQMPISKPSPSVVVSSTTSDSPVSTSTAFSTPLEHGRMPSSPYAGFEPLPSPSRSSFKRVSKLNKTHPAISILEENVGYVTGLAYDVIASVAAENAASKTVLSATRSIDSTASSDIPELTEQDPNEQNKSLNSSTAKEIKSFDCNSSEIHHASCNSLHSDTTQLVELDETPRESVTTVDYSINSSLLSNCTQNSIEAPESVSRQWSLDAVDSKTMSLISNTSLNTTPHSSNKLNTTQNSSTPPSSCSSTPQHISNANANRSQEEDVDSILLLEKRSFRPFKNPEDYLYAMREDLAEWLNCLYELSINADNFFEMLETGEVLCQHANAVRSAAEEAARNGRRLSGRWRVPQTDVVWRPGVESGSFRARDNVSNFIRWCRELGVHEVLLFETDDLVLRKNEKHVILALLEVARQGHKLGMAAPLLVQMEDDIDRQERLLEEKRALMQESKGKLETMSGDDQDPLPEHEEPIEPPQIFYGPTAQIVTNDLRNLDEMVRALLENCKCESQFPMHKLSDGKYRIGKTKIIIFVRILRNHVMVRVGGGWDTLEHFLNKHDPCRCKAGTGHRTLMSSHMEYKQVPNQDRQLLNVTYDRSEDGSSPLAGRRRSSGLQPRRDSGGPVPNRDNSGSVPDGDNSGLAPNRENSGPAPNKENSGLVPNRDNSITSLRQRSQSPANIVYRPNAGRPSISHPHHPHHHHHHHQSTLNPSLDEVAGRSPEPPGGWCDTSSEVSDEGYRSQGAPPRPSPRTRRNHRKLSIGDSSLNERPESSMTHTSSEGSTVSTDDLGVPPTPPRSPPAGDTASAHCLTDHASLSSTPGVRSHIPQLSRGRLTSTESLNKVMGQKKKKNSIGEEDRPAWNSGPGNKKEDMKRRGSCADLSSGYSISRSRSTTSETGFHSLTRNTPVRKSLSASRPSGSGNRLNELVPNTGKCTWNGRTGRGRPQVNSESYRPPALPRGVRSASASPGPIRRNFGHSAPVTPQTRSPEQSAPNSNLNSPTHSIALPDIIRQNVPDLGEINSKPTVEMLAQLERLVNVYRVKVLDHFAEEGKVPPPELADDFSCSWVRGTQSLTNSPKKTPRSKRTEDKPALKVTPRRDGLGSRIPAPTFLSSRNTSS